MDTQSKKAGSGEGGNVAQTGTTMEERLRKVEANVDDLLRSTQGLTGGMSAIEERIIRLLRGKPGDVKVVQEPKADKGEPRSVRKKAVNVYQNSYRKSLYMLDSECK